MAVFGLIDPVGGKRCYSYEKNFASPAGDSHHERPGYVRCSVRYDAKTWRTVQTYDVVTLSKNLDAHMRELVAVKRNFRGKDIHHMKPNWYESSIWQNIPGERGKFAHVSVMVANPDLAAFKSIPTDSSGAEITLYGRA